MGFYCSLLLQDNVVGCLKKLIEYLGLTLTRGFTDLVDHVARISNWIQIYIDRTGHLPKHLCSHLISYLSKYLLDIFLTDLEFCIANN